MSGKPGAKRLRTEAAALVWLLGLPLVPAVVAGWGHPRRPDWAALRAAGSAERVLVSPAEVAASYPEALWLDARPAAEYAAGHVPGALRLTYESWEDDFAALAGAWDGRRVIVVYCGSASCQTSEGVARRLRADLGFAAVYALEGGWEAWRAREGGR